MQPCRISVKSTGTAPSSCTDTSNIGNLFDMSYNFSLGAGDNGNVTSITNNRDNTRSQSFTSDALNRINSAATQATSGPNAWGLQFGYDTRGNLLSVVHQKGTTTLDGASYTVDNAGNRQSRTALPGTTATNFTYDAIYELLTAKQGSTTKESYTYDPVGNRLSNLGGSGWSNNSSNELTSKPSFTYTYDLNGNTLTSVTGSNTTTYTWDFENRLTGVTLPGTGAVSASSTIRLGGASTNPPLAAPASTPTTKTI